MQRYYSNIYWHFTGSPENLDWHRIKSPQDILKYGGEPKSDERCFEILQKILSSRELLASSSEKIKENLTTKPFCSVTDIPFKDLLSQKKYYGNVAVGFKPNVIHKSFLPVIYIPSNNLPMVEMIDQHSFKEEDTNGLEQKRSIDRFLMNYIKVTTFTIEEEHSFYREREWRHIGDFTFSEADISAIVVSSSYVSDVRDMLQKYEYPQDISVISWDVIEYS
ncbi:abortive infection system antitoxin AbiGi family protein [Bacillaceae bacterium S4-13-58]